MSFEHITIITIITGIADITVIGTGTIERNFLVKGRCGTSFAVAPHVSGWSIRAKLLSKDEARRIAVNIAKPRSSHAGDLPVMTMRHTSLENDVRDLVVLWKTTGFRRTCDTGHRSHFRPLLAWY